MQFNWPELAEVPDILADLAEVDMHAIQTSGSCIRNVTTDQFAGVAADEIGRSRALLRADPPMVHHHPEFDWLPRKFKIAVTGASTIGPRSPCTTSACGVRDDDRRSRCSTCLSVAVWAAPR